MRKSKKNSKRYEKNASENMKNQNCKNSKIEKIQVRTKNKREKSKIKIIVKIRKKIDTFDHEKFRNTRKKQN